MSAVFSLHRFVRKIFLPVCFALLLFLSAFTASAGDFNWERHSGDSLLVLLSKHPYAETIISHLDKFEQLTGIQVAVLVIPEARYFSTLAKSFTAVAGRPDVFMTGPYQVWEYALQGHMAELDLFLTNPIKTRATYAYRDFFPAVSGAFRWNGKAGQKTGDGALWAIPMGFETNSLSYNHEVLATFRLSPPASIEDMIDVGSTLRDFNGKGSYGVAVRGANAWNTLHSGYMTAYVNYGAEDMVVENGKLVSKVNSPKAVAMTDLWLDMLDKAGPVDWHDYDWYRCAEELGSRKAAMMFDADIFGYLKNVEGVSSQSGRLALALPLAPRGADPAGIKSNLWVWGLSINEHSERKDAAWFFIQYFTSKEFQTYSVLEAKAINPPRRSIFESSAFLETIASMEGFSQTFAALFDNTAIQFTPNPHFSEIAGKWVATLHDIADGKYVSTQDGMNDLKRWMDERLRDVPVE